MLAGAVTTATCGTCEQRGLGAAPSRQDNTSANDQPRHGRPAAARAKLAGIFRAATNPPKHALIEPANIKPQPDKPRGKYKNNASAEKRISHSKQHKPRRQSRCQCQPGRKMLAGAVTSGCCGTCEQRGPSDQHQAVQTARKRPAATRPPAGSSTNATHGHNWRATWVLQTAATGGPTTCTKRGCGTPPIETNESRDSTSNRTWRRRCHDTEVDVIGG